LGTSDVTILLVEGFACYRSLVQSLLEFSSFQLVGEASDGLEAVEKAQQLRPDLILMEIALAKLNGLETAKRIRQFLPQSKIVFLTLETSAEVVEEALRLGAFGYILKHQAGTDLLAGIEVACQGRRFISSDLAIDLDSAD
jgi:DNA-binding NarL/FixJ family response regulator